MRWLSCEMLMPSMYSIVRTQGVDNRHTTRGTITKF